MAADRAGGAGYVLDAGDGFFGGGGGEFEGGVGCGGQGGSFFGAAGGGGTVRVDVHLHGAPAGTTATVAGTGVVTVTPLNIQTSMPSAR